MKHRLNSPVVTAIITALLYGLFIAARLSQVNFDASAFVVAGDRFCDPSQVPTGLRVISKSDGYDGQFYYRLALNPFTSKPAEFGIELDNPFFRQQRIFYPLLVWSLSGGNERAVVLWLLLVNFIAISVLALIAGLIAQVSGRHALLGLTFSLYPGFLFTISRDLTEILAICFVLAGILLVRKKRFSLATMLLTFGILTKETTLLFSVGLIMMSVASALELTARAEGRIPWYVGGMPLLVYGAWRVVLTYNWADVLHAYPDRSRGAIGLPFKGLTTFISQGLDFSAPIHIRWSVGLLFILVFVSIALKAFRTSGASVGEKACFVFYAMLAAVLTRWVWVEDWAFMRALTEFYMAGSLIVVQSSSTLSRVALASCAGVWAFLASALLGRFGAELI
ncbi:AZOBR_p60025 family cell surface glycopolymer formation protein [Candidatus Nitrospira bockiana]